MPVRAMRWISAVALVGAASAIGASVVAQEVEEHQAAATTSPCTDPQPHLLVLGRTRRLHRCVSGQSAGTYRVALGRGGLHKKVEGDGKTPIGRYALGKARRSTSYLRFIPVQYPTAEQRREGFTGGDIGVHGPPREGVIASFPSPFRSLWRNVNWTEGCIALNDDYEIDAIVRWVTEHHVSRIELRDE